MQGEGDYIKDISSAGHLNLAYTASEQGVLRIQSPGKDVQKA